MATRHTFRPTKKDPDLRSLARSYATLGVRTLAGIMQHSENDNARVAACALLFDRGFGKAATMIEGDAQITVIVRQLTPDPNMIEHEQLEIVSQQQSE